jgi:hypothetical protein
MIIQKIHETDRTWMTYGFTNGFATPGIRETTVICRMKFGLVSGFEQLQLKMDTGLGYRGEF